MARHAIVACPRQQTSTIKMHLTGDEKLIGIEATEARAIDFWRWAYSNLCGNVVRGVFAEWLVARILEIPTEQRIEWDSCDLVTPDGVRIEVKAGGYLQSWHTNHPPSRITFSRLRATPWSPETGFAPGPSFNAHIYVFCIHIGVEVDSWNAFDLSQWRFYLLKRAALEALNQDTIGLPTLRRLASELDAQGLRTAGRLEILAIVEAGLAHTDCSGSASGEQGE